MKGTHDGSFVPRLMKVLNLGDPELMGGSAERPLLFSIHFPIRRRPSAPSQDSLTAHGPRILQHHPRAHAPRRRAGRHFQRQVVVDFGPRHSSRSRTSSHGPTSCDLPRSHYFCTAELHAVVQRAVHRFKVQDRAHGSVATSIHAVPWPT
jgi:hypothetical protein